MARKLPIPNGRLDGALDANGMRIVNLADPLSDDDAATKGFVRKNAVNAGVKSLAGKTGDLTLEDVGALPKSGGEVGEQGSAAGTLTLAATYDEAPKIDMRQSFLRAGVVSVPNSGMYDNSGSGPRASILKGGKEVATEEQVEAVKNQIGTPVEVTGEYEDGASFSFNFLTAGA